MKLMVPFMLAFVLPFIPSLGFGGDRSEIVLDCLEQIACDTEDDFDEENATQEVAWVSWTQEGFFGRMSRNASERQLFQRAFDEVILQFATNDWRVSERIDRPIPREEVARILLCQMRAMSYTNAVSSVRRWVLNTRAPHRDLAVGLYCDWAPLNGDFLHIVGTILTNTAFSAGCDRIQTFWSVTDALSRHGRRWGKDADYINLLNLLYRSRLSSVECAAGLDNLFCNEFSGYAFSSNRLETVRDWLINPSCGTEVAARCVQITNQLANATNPLEWVEELSGL